MLDRFTRYGVWPHNHVANVRPEPKGDWLRYADAEKVVGRLERQLADAQATIADLQGQVAQLEESVIIRTREAQEEKRLHKEFADMYYQASERETALQQRVAQLERERDDALHAAQGMSNDLTALGQKYEAELDTLQADHARVLGLVEAATKLLTELTIIPIGCSREQELAWKKAVKDLRVASLPAQPAQGGALKEVTT